MVYNNIYQVLDPSVNIVITDPIINGTDENKYYLGLELDDTNRSIVELPAGTNLQYSIFDEDSDYDQIFTLTLDNDLTLITPSQIFP